jgi:hypothetical protein
MASRSFGTSKSYLVSFVTHVAELLFGLPQVQQQLQLLGGMLLHDPRMKLAKVKQQQPRRHSSSAAVASQQQQALTKLQQTLPLAAVCVRAMQGCYCSLDELQAEFKAAAEKIR